jgi:hypothetical protein
MLPSLSLPPLEFCFGTSPIQAEKSRPDRNVSGVKPVVPQYAQRLVYWLVSDGHNRLPAVLVGDADPDLPAAVIIPLRADFALRADAALRLWRLVTGRTRGGPPDRLTRQRRRRLILTLCALDGRLAGESYRVIAAALFGDARIPAGRGWKTHDLRDRTIRLVRAGIALMQGGYLDLLRE